MLSEQWEVMWWKWVPPSPARTWVRLPEGAEVLAVEAGGFWLSRRVQEPLQAATAPDVGKEPWPSLASPMAVLGRQMTTEERGRILDRLAINRTDRLTPTKR